MPEQQLARATSVGQVLDLLGSSLPEALPGSLQTTANKWIDDRSASEVVAGFVAADAPIPAAATLRRERTHVLSVTTPWRRAGIFVRDEPQGSSYIITAGPSLSITGSGLPFDGETFAAVCPAPLNPDPDSKGFVALPTIGKEPWLILVGFSEQDDKSLQGMAVIGPQSEMSEGTLTKLASTAAAHRSLVGAATITRTESGRIDAHFTAADRSISLSAYVTDPISMAASIFGVS